MIHIATYVTRLHIIQHGKQTLASKVFIMLDWNIRLFPTLLSDQSTPDVSAWTSLSRPVSDLDAFIYIHVQ